MSAKKQSQPLWYDCSKCDRRLLRVFATKHNDSNCGIIFPMIEQGILVTTLSKPLQNSKISKLPFIKTSLGSSTIFLSEACIRECGFETFNWVLVTSIVPSSSTEGKGEASDELSSVGVALRVWPIPDGQQVGQSGNSNAHAMMTTEGLSVNNFVSGNEQYSIQKLNTSFVSQASSVEIHVKNRGSTIDGDSSKRFCQNVKRNFQNRIVTNGNCFRLSHYADSVTFTFRIIVPNDDLETSSLCKEMSVLTTCDSEEKPCSDNKTTFYMITNETEFHLVRDNDDDYKKSEGGDDSSNFTTFENIGGMENCIQEISSTIKYRFSVLNSVSSGILIHGQHGTGKSLLVRAVCNSFKLNTIVFREFPIHEEFGKQFFTSERFASNLNHAFRVAVASQPAAIVIENIETYAPNNKASRTSQTIYNFSETLKTLISSIKQARVIVLATCSNTDLLDVALRSPHIFGKEIETPVPLPSQREDICIKILQGRNHTLNSQEIKTIASNTHGFVGADLLGLFSQSAVIAAREHLTSNSSGDGVEFNVSSYNFSIHHVQQAMKSIRPSAMKSILIDVPNVKFSDIGGQKELKAKLKQAIEWPLKHPEAFQRLGINPPKGILMYGPPGCSKTMIAKAIATESGLNFISVKGSELFSKWVGESEKAVQKIFRKARQVAPCIVFFDEIDSLGGERGSSSSGASNVHERVLAQLLIEIDGVEPLKDVTIVAATNRPDIIDQALLRPGRLDSIIYVPLPDAEARDEIFKILFRKMPVCQTPETIPKLVKATEGYSGAEITAICHEAALNALNENINAAVITDEHFDLALNTERPRISKEQLQFYENYSKGRKIK